MNGEVRMLKVEVPVNAAIIEKQPILEQKTAIISDSTIVLPKINTVKPEDRFVRLKKHLRKRSASIL